MTSAINSFDKDHQNSLEWRLYHGMLVTRLFEDALIPGSRKGKFLPKPFRAKGRKRLRSAAAWHWKRAALPPRILAGADQYLPFWDERPFLPSVDAIIAAGREMMEQK
jgi:hypothetical protein